VFRCSILQQVQDKHISQVKAAAILKISDRQIRNLLHVLQSEGPKGLISKKRGRISNNSLPQALKEEVVELIKAHYDDFGPTLAKEKLAERHQITMSVETVRKLMIQHKLLVPRAKKTKVHQTRFRRENFGELIQVDASIHHWFEGRGDSCALIVFIDDATSKITHMKFHKSECLEGYFQGFEAHLTKCGIPLGVYSDRHAIFGGAECIKHAQLCRAFEELGIERILARSPQAKGRVERVNQTLQDRLIKEMRLRDISNIEEANVFLQEYIDIHNEKFSKEPRGSIDTHRPLDDSHNLHYILAKRETRTVSNSLSISFNNKTINILEAEMKNRLKGSKVDVIEHNSGEIEVYYKGKLLKTSLIEEATQERMILDHKEKAFWKPKGYKPGANHPWRKYGYQIPLANELRKNRKYMI